MQSILRQESLAGWTRAIFETHDGVHRKLEMVQLESVLLINPRKRCCVSVAVFFLFECVGDRIVILYQIQAFLQTANIFFLYILYSI